MKLIQYTIIIIGINCLLHSCKIEEETGCHLLYKEHLIDSYIYVDSIYITQISNTIFEIKCHGPLYSITDKDPVNYNIFQELANKHNDDFNREASVDFGYRIGDNISFANNFTKIDIYSNIPWDDSHKAGGSLGDICYFTAQSYAPAIEGKTLYGIVGEVKKRINDLTESDLRTLKFETLQLHFPYVEHIPDQTLTIILRTDDERVFIANYKIDKSI